MPIDPSALQLPSCRNAARQRSSFEVPGFTHFQTPRFAEPIRQVVDWLRGIWDAGAR